MPLVETMFCGEGLVENNDEMTQEERWLKRYEEVVGFIETNKRNPSKHDEEERGNFLNWLKANRKALNAGKMIPFLRPAGSNIC